MSKLKELDLYNQEPGLVGTIPDELADMAHLSLLDLSQNQLILSIPPEISNMEDLKSLDLSLNGFSESIPSQLGKLKGISIKLVLCTYPLV